MLRPAYALMRATGRGTGYFLAAVFAALLVLCELVERVPTELPVVDDTGNLVFGIVLVATIVIEVWLRRHGDRSLRRALGARRRRVRSPSPS